MAALGAAVSPEHAAILAEATRITAEAMARPIRPPVMPAVGDTFEVYGHKIRVVAVHDGSVDVVIDGLE